jgi:hypothetical protein
VLIKVEKGFIRRPWIEVDELARWTSHHLKGTLLMERVSLCCFTDGTRDFLHLYLRSHLYQHDKMGIKTLSPFPFPPIYAFWVNIG